MKQSPATPLFTASLAALDLPVAGDVPDWVHLLPVSTGELRTFDGRGPYRITDAAAVIAASFTADPRDQGRLIIDENHSSMLAAPKGGPSPARGKIVEMETRADGIWGRVEWNATGRALMADQSYRGISPVIIHDTQGRVLRIKNASLVNYANLRGLAALNQETPMNWANIAKALGLAEDATEEQILAAITDMKGKKAEGMPALQASIAEIGTALGVTGTDPAAIVAAAKLAAKPSELTALQAELTSTATELKSLRDDRKRDKAETFVDGAIKAGRVGVKPGRERFITLHMEDAASTETLINGFPALGPNDRLTGKPPASSEELTSLNAEQVAVANQLGIPHDKFLASLQADIKKDDQA
jgi:phage I-like protein